jgi:hypothetical protein
VLTYVEAAGIKDVNDQYFGENTTIARVDMKVEER